VYLDYKLADRVSTLANILRFGAVIPSDYYFDMENYLDFTGNMFNMEELKGSKIEKDYLNNFKKIFNDVIRPDISEAMSKKKEEMIHFKSPNYYPLILCNDEIKLLEELNKVRLYFDLILIESNRDAINDFDDLDDEVNYLSLLGIHKDTEIADNFLK
jgi:hypothetical protein